MLAQIVLGEDGLEQAAPVGVVGDFALVVQRHRDTGADVHHLDRGWGHDAVMVGLATRAVNVGGVGGRLGGGMGGVSLHGRLLR